VLAATRGGAGVNRGWWCSVRQSRRSPWWRRRSRGQLPLALSLYAAYGSLLLSSRLSVVVASVCRGANGAMDRARPCWRRSSSSASLTLFVFRISGAAPSSLLPPLLPSFMRVRKGQLDRSSCAVRLLITPGVS
jgi:hypothetical protein